MHLAQQRIERDYRKEVRGVKENVDREWPEFRRMEDRRVLDEDFDVIKTRRLLRKAARFSSVELPDRPMGGGSSPARNKYWYETYDGNLVFTSAGTAKVAREIQEARRREGESWAAMGTAVLNILQVIATIISGLLALTVLRS